MKSKSVTNEEGGWLIADNLREFSGIQDLKINNWVKR